MWSLPDTQQSHLLLACWVTFLKFCSEGHELFQRPNHILKNTLHGLNLHLHNTRATFKFYQHHTNQVLEVPFYVVNQHSTNWKSKLTRNRFAIPSNTRNTATFFSPAVCLVEPATCYWSPFVCLISPTLPERSPTVAKNMNKREGQVLQRIWLREIPQSFNSYQSYTSSSPLLLKIARTCSSWPTSFKRCLSPCNILSYSSILWFLNSSSSLRVSTSAWKRTN